ncbi:MAG TPA: helix-turn-helix domain-containing protein [Tetragenococcus sp.]|nr:helix-turn-helix domain-containing protein [Tetragenococcus sp.]
MYLAKNNHFLKRDILDLLDNQTDFLTMTQIVESLKYPSLHAVKSSCHLLKENIDQLYDPTELELIISQRGGVRLKRNNVSLQKLTDNINSQAIAYQLTVQLLANKMLNVNRYCEENYLSKSTLARYAKKAKIFIKKFGPSGIDITLSDSIRITGEEAILRITFYFILKSGYNRLTKVADKKRILKQTKQILHYLNISVNQTQLQHLALWVFVCQNAVDHKWLLQKEENFFTYANSYQYIAQPDFLVDWQAADWQLFLLFFYSLGYISVNGAVILKQDDLFKETIDCWFASFEKYFFAATKEQKEQMTAVLQHQIQYYRLTQFTDNIQEAIESPRMPFFEEHYPVYSRKFQGFWQDFTLCLPDSTMANGLYADSLTDCIALAPLDYFMPRLLIYVITETTAMHMKLIEGIIKNYCANYKIDFVNDFHEADIIISSVNFVDPLEDWQILINIRTSLPKNDLKHIYQVVKRLTKEKRR